MGTSPSLPPPDRAWMPLDTRYWDEDAARHLLRRLGFAALPGATALALKEGPALTVRRAFGALKRMPMPEKISDLSEESETVRAKLRNLTPEERREFLRELRQKNEGALRDFNVAWLAFTRRNDTAAQEKFVMFLQDIFVVSAEKVKDVETLFDYQATLRSSLDKDYATLVRSVMKHPAMIEYLDSNRNRKGQPNENFARELFELFCLGEGNYTEKDVKEAARAMTGVTLRQKRFHLDPSQHDKGEKTIFGQKGAFDPDGLVDLTVRQPACAAFAPQELIKFYLTAEGLPRAYAESFGRTWRASGMKLQELPRILFNSTLFYHPAFRGNLIKSPVAYYMGLCQDLGVDTFPYPGPLINAMRSMGQPFFNPPSVRGWIYGRNWISSTTLAARRAVARGLFQVINEEKLNADEIAALKEARAAGQGRPTVTPDRLEYLAQNRTNAEIVHHLCNYFLPTPVPAAFRQVLEGHLKSDKNRIQSLQEIVTAILQAPSYQLS